MQKMRYNRSESKGACGRGGAYVGRIISAPTETSVPTPLAGIPRKLHVSIHLMETGDHRALFFLQSGRDWDMMGGENTRWKGAFLMRDGFIKVAAGTPNIRVADCEYNAGQIIALMKEAAAQGVKVLALPELCVTGYTCGDLFLQDTLLQGAEDALSRILEETSTLDMLTAVGLPVRCQNELYNCAAVISKGRILGLVPKNHIPNYGEFYEARWFTSGVGLDSSVTLCGQYPDLYSSQLFVCEEMPNLTVGVELCEDLWAVMPPSTHLAALGATVILNLSASDEVAGKSAYRRQLVAGQSGRLVCGYVYADAGEGESTTDLVHAGHNMIVENGVMLAENPSFKDLDIITEIDVKRLMAERRRMTTFPLYVSPEKMGYQIHTFRYEKAEKTELTRYFEKTPFVPATKTYREERCDEILNIQASGLAKRLRHTGCQSAVIGLSGGLDRGGGLRFFFTLFHSCYLAGMNPYKK